MSRRGRSYCHAYLAFHLKFLNYLQLFVAVSILVYSAWMLTRWNDRAHPLPPAPPPHSFHLPLRIVSGLDDNLAPPLLGPLPAPWFIYTFMGVGITLCLVTCIGHIAAEAVNGCCLCFYTLLTMILIMFEAALTGFLFIDKHWEQDLPPDPTGELDRFRNFIQDNIDIVKWIGVGVIVIQALSLLLALILRTMVSTRNVDYESDDDYSINRGGIRQPLLNQQGPQASASTFVDTKGNQDAWSTRLREKYGLTFNDFITNHASNHQESAATSRSNEESRWCSIM